MRVIVTGASGFLGATVVRSLAARDVEVVPVSRRPLPHAVQVTEYADAPDGDVLVHLAEEKERAHAEERGEACVEAAQHVLMALLGRSWRRVVYASSAVLYGDRDCAPRTVTDPVCATDVYSRMKLTGERAVLDARGGAVARLANLYGPGMADNNVVSTILRQVDGDGEVVVRNDKPVRDFVWVDDAAEAITCMVLEGVTGVFNVGSGEGISIGQLAALVLKLTGRQDRTVRASAPRNDSSCIVLDISATVTNLSWRPKIDLECGLGQLLRNRAAAETGHGA